MVKSRETKEYHTANQLKKCKKKYFQGIHDRFIRDPEFRKRMIENNRDEDFYRKWDALADEDHTHHLTPQEYSLYKSNRWLHSNKVPTLCERKHRAAFKKALSTLQQLKPKEEGALQTPSNSHGNINNGHKVLLHGGIGKVHGGFLIPMKVTMEMKPSTYRTVRLVVQYLK